MDLRACARCASLDLHGQTLGEGLAVGMEGMASVCAECGFQGQPLLFAKEEDYRDFRAAQRGPAGHERSARVAAEDADRDADASAREAASLPMPPGLESPLAMYRLPMMMPTLVFAIGAMCLVLGLLSLGLSRGFSPAALSQGVAGLPLALLGLGFMLVAWRLTHKPRAP